MKKTKSAPPKVNSNRIRTLARRILKAQQQRPNVEFKAAYVDEHGKRWLPPAGSKEDQELDRIIQKERDKDEDLLFAFLYMDELKRNAIRMYFDKDITHHVPTVRRLLKRYVKRFAQVQNLILDDGPFVRLLIASCMAWNEMHKMLQEPTRKIARQTVNLASNLSRHQQRAAQRRREGWKQLIINTGKETEATLLKDWKKKDSRSMRKHFRKTYGITKPPGHSTIPGLLAEISAEKHRRKVDFSN